MGRESGSERRKRCPGSSCPCTPRPPLHAPFLSQKFIICRFSPGCMSRGATGQHGAARADDPEAMRNGRPRWRRAFGWAWCWGDVPLWMLGAKVGPGVRGGIYLGREDWSRSPEHRSTSCCVSCASLYLFLKSAASPHPEPATDSTSSTPSASSGHDARLQPLLQT